MESEADSILTDLSSELSSVRSSPEPPEFLHAPCSASYPTPTSSQDHSTCTSGSEGVPHKRARATDSLPPAKKRKTAEATAKSTLHLDLRPSSDSSVTEQPSQLDLLMKVLHKRRKIVVIAGAGISTSAGGKFCNLFASTTNIDLTTVPDFRSSTGLFNTLKSDKKLKASGKHLFDASVYQRCQTYSISSHACHSRK